MLQLFGSIWPCIPAHIPAHKQCEGWYISKKTGMLWTTWKAVSNSAHKQLQDAFPSRLMMGRVEQDYMKGPDGISRPKCSWVSQDTTANTGINKQCNVSPGACSLQLDLTEQFGQMRSYSVTPANRSAQQEIIELKYSAGTLSSSDNPSQMDQKGYIENGVMCWTAAQGLQIALEELFRTRGMNSMTSMRILPKKVILEGCRSTVSKMDCNALVTGSQET
jgi:hypothetical protein